MSAYTKRKYVAQEVESFFEIPEGKQIAKILRGQGNNLHLVETQDGEQFLASMPTKFRKYVWVKRGDFVLIEPIEEGVKVKAEIIQVILRNQIKNFKKEGIWPKRFCDEDDCDIKTLGNGSVAQVDDENDADRANDQDEESYSEDSELEDNPNHRPRFFCSDEDDEEDDDEEEDDEEDEDESIKNMPKNDDQESVEKETSAVHVTQKMAEK